MIVVAPRFVEKIGKLMTGRSDTRAAAIFPFIFLRDDSENVPWVINHERIHFRQQLDTLFVGIWLVSLYEHFYARYVLNLSKQEAYLYKAGEQEAYRNQQDFEYLSRRKFGAVYWYIFHKRRFTFGAPGEIVYQD